MEQEERDRRYSSLIYSLFNDSVDHGFLADKRKGISDEVVRKTLRKFVQQPEVSRAVEQFIKQISSHFLSYLPHPSSTRKQASTPVETQQVTLEESLNKPKRIEPSPVEPLSPALGNDSASVSSKKTNDVTSASSQPPVQSPRQLPQINNSIAVANTAYNQQLKPGAIPVGHSPKTPVTLDQTRVTFSIATNGKVNEPFCSRIEGNTATSAKVVVQRVDIPEGLGLSFDQASGELQGTPIVAGDYNFRVYFQFELPGIDKPKLLEGECSLIINPDPKTLWKNQPSDQDDPYWKKDEDSLTIQGDDGLRMVVVSKRGRSHAHVGSFRDDDFCLYGMDSNGWRILTVADGAGGSKKSRRGSFIASRKASEHIVKNLLSIERDQKVKQALALWATDMNAGAKPIKDELYYLFGQAAKEAVCAIDEEARDRGLPYKDYSTTLLIAIHKKFEVGHFIGAYWLGDGAIGLYRRGQEIRVLGKADSGEFAGQTRFLDNAMVNNAKEIWDRINFAIVPDFTALAVMTDGITDPHFETDANLENVIKWDQFWKQIEPHLNSANPEADMLSWLDFWSPGNHDDRTIALLCANKLSDHQQVQGHRT